MDKYFVSFFLGIVFCFDAGAQVTIGVYGPDSISNPSPNTKIEVYGELVLASLSAVAKYDLALPGWSQ